MYQKLPQRIANARFDQFLPGLRLASMRVDFADDYGAGARQTGLLRRSY